MKRIRHRLGLVGALTLAVSAVWVVPGPAAYAQTGYCPKGTGATVVVDYGPLGGGLHVACDPGGANTPASTVVPRVGFDLEYVTSQPGFVCRVNGKPGPAQEACAKTPPSNAYWGVFRSDGTSGTWSYASVGVGSLKVPAGGFIGLRWQDGGTDYPGAAPKAPSAAPPPKPTPQPTSQPTRTPKPKPDPTRAPKSAPTRVAASKQPTTTPASGSASPTGPGGSSSPATGRPSRSGDPTGSAAAPALSEVPTATPGDAAAAAAPQPAGKQTKAGTSPALWGAAALAVAVLLGAALVLARRRGAHERP